jgi:hypothetical protein
MKNHIFKYLLNFSFFFQFYFLYLYIMKRNYLFFEFLKFVIGLYLIKWFPSGENFKSQTSLEWSRST